MLRADYTLARPGSQRGAALVIGLVLLLVLTILAVSTMRTASLELAMAGNAQFRENAFQLAESGIENMIRQIDAGLVFPVPTENWEQTYATQQIVELNGEYETRQRFNNAGTLTTCGSLDTFTAYHFEIEAEGRAQREARSRQTRGFYLCGPSGL
jgi:Tfp pilus assembly protein PilX